MPPRELVDDVIPEILLRLPPDEPQWLIRAALACKRWLSTVSDPAFLRRYRAFHGVPPLLGLIDSDPVTARRAAWVSSTEAVPAFPSCGPRFIATAAVPAFPIPATDTFSAFPLDCRHGRILIHNIKDGDGHFLVCDPITGDRHRVPRPDFGADSLSVIDATAVFCAVAGCQHLDCHGGPFYLIVIFSDLLSPYANKWATMYSSETGAWSAPATSPTLDIISEAYGRGALVGEGIYFTLAGSNTGILKYDWRKSCLSVLKPQPLAGYSKRGQVVLMEMKDTSLGLAAIQYSSIHLWSRAVSSVDNAEWSGCRVIDLEKMMPMANPNDGAYVVGSAEGVDAIFITTAVGLFMIELNSGRVKKVGEPRRKTNLNILPYMSFYTPDRCRLPLRGGPADL